LQLKLITAGADPATSKLIEQINEYQINLLRPRNFDTTDPENYLKTLDVSFENLCTSLEELGVTSPHELSVFRFYSKFAYFKKRKRPKA
jgi:hypothetical protein